MKITTELVSKFAGGQMEIQNAGKGYIYRGEVRTATVEDDSLKVQFTWLAKGDGFLPRGWVNHIDLSYEASLEIYSVSDIGPSGSDIRPSGHGTGGGNRLCLTSSMTGETVVIFPPDGSKLDPKKVIGLELGEPKQVS